MPSSKRPHGDARRAPARNGGAVEGTGRRVERADAREKVLTERETDIRQGIGDLEEFISSMEEEARDPDTLERIASLKDELDTLRQQERREQVSRTEQEAADREEVAAMPPDLRKAAAILTGRRGMMKPAESFMAYLVRNGGVADMDAPEIFRDVRRVGLLRKQRDAVGRGGRVVRDFDDWGEFYNEFPHGLPERPTRNDVMTLMSEAARGRDPWWFHVGEDGADS